MEIRDVWLQRMGKIIAKFPWTFQSTPTFAQNQAAMLLYYSLWHNSVYKYLRILDNIFVFALLWDSACLPSAMWLMDKHSPESGWRLLYFIGRMSVVRCCAWNCFWKMFQSRRTFAEGCLSSTSFQQTLCNILQVAQHGLLHIYIYIYKLLLPIKSLIWPWNMPEVPK